MLPAALSQTTPASVGEAKAVATVALTEGPTVDAQGVVYFSETRIGVRLELHRFRFRPSAIVSVRKLVQFEPDSNYQLLQVGRAAPKSSP
jgi:hypothetical protein